MVPAILKLVDVGETTVTCDKLYDDGDTPVMFTIDPATKEFAQVYVISEPLPETPVIVKFDVGKVGDINRMLLVFSTDTDSPTKKL